MQQKHKGGPGDPNGSFADLTFYWLSLLVALFISAHSVQAQEIVRRPSVGVALSGGGALGIAHLGVLKVMEESGLRPDYIAGVSMGAVIGGMYSLGYSADSILNILRSMDLNNAITNKIPENKIIYPEKRNFQNSITSFPVSFKKVSLPSGITNGQVIENNLSFYAWPAADISDFSKLPIPFVCVASDILTAKIIEIKSGYLPDAIRASLAIPSVFTPVKMDSALLLDGGIYRNFPPGEVSAMGADIIIGSYTGFRWRSEEELESVSSIIRQVAFSMGMSDFEIQRKLVDYLVIPDLKGVSSMDFSRVDSIYMRGYLAADNFRDQFRRLADSLNRFGPQKPLSNILDKDFYRFDGIRIAGNKNYTDRQITGILDIHPGDSVNKYMLKDKIDLLYGKNWFEKVKYRIKPVNDSLILEIECIEKPVAILYGSVHYDDATGSAIILSFCAKNFLFPGSAFNLDTYIGKYARARTGFVQYLGWKQSYSISADLNYAKSLIPLLHLKNESGAVKSGTFDAGLNISRRFGLNNMLGLSGIYENLSLSPDYVSESGIKNISYNYLTFTMKYGINTLDTKHFPNKGTLFEISGGTSKLLSASIKNGLNRTNYDRGNRGEFLFDRFYTLRTGLRQYVSKVRNVTFSFHADGLYVSKCDSAMAANNFFLLGGIQSVDRRTVPVIGFHTFEIPVQMAAGAGIELDYEVFRDIHITLAGDVFAIRDIYHSNEYKLIAGFGAGAGYMSIVGPIKIGIMYGKNPYESYFNDFKGYISLGFNF